MGEASEKKQDIIENSIGVFGRWHLWICLWICAVKFPVGWHQMSILFQAPAIEFTCVDPNITDECSPKCPGHVFDRSIFSETITTQWDLVCDRFQYNNLTQLITMLGILTGSLLFGIISDRYGRKGPLVASVMVQTVFGCASAFVPWFWLHLLLRFICTTATGGTMITSFVLIMELVGLKWRTTAGILYQIPFNLGHLTLPFFGYFIRDWRYNQLVLSAMSVVLFVYFWVLPESPRWLLAVGEVDRAVKILERAAHHNRLPGQDIKTNVNNFARENDLKVVKGGDILALVRTRNLRIRTVCICFNWLVFGMCFFGVAQYVGELGGNVFVNVAVSAVFEVPGTLASIWASEKLGRKPSMITANVIGGVACLGIAFIPEDVSWIKTVLSAIGLFSMSAAFSIIYIYTGELFPTVIRNVGCGTASVFARVGSITAPFIAKADDAPTWMASVVFGVTPLIGACLCLFLPETLKCKLPDTVEEAEAFGAKPIQVKTRH